MDLSETQIIEYFHLAFLDVLQARLGQERYVVKGGVNLRYFFGSHRYSEDIDLDAIDIEAWKLREVVDGVLSSTPMQLLLRSGGLTLGSISKPKQTETTQRWKAPINARGRREPTRTKIEFSHREADPRRILEAVPDRVVAPYALRPPTTLHYTASAAIEQKIVALAKRSETQARDVFDLELLLRRHRGAIEPRALESSIVEMAMEKAIDLPVEAFAAQVMPFLDLDIAELYTEPRAWEQMQSYVVDRLGELQ